MYKEDIQDYLADEGNGNHSSANGDIDNDDVADIRGTDSYFKIPLTEKQYIKLGRVLNAYAERKKRVPKYGILAKRCTSMANTALRKAGIRLFFLSFLKAFSPHQYYKALKRLGYEEIILR
jgi:hypothetical protein